MEFQDENCDQFLQLFDSVKNNIRKSEGCHALELIRDIDKPNIFFTISIWDSPDDLENYRKSNLFKDTWSKTKKLFNARPLAWTTESITSLN